MKMSIYAEEVLAIFFAFSENGHLMWGSTFPVIVFTANRAVTRFFHSKVIPQHYGMHATTTRSIILS